MSEEEVNHTINSSYLSIIRKDSAKFNVYPDTWCDAKQYEYTKYQIKETDMRVKTMTFTSPHYFDLTEGQYWVLITSPFHENFSGILLKVEYDASNGLYSYQCQDMSRLFMDTFSRASPYTVTTITTTTDSDDGESETKTETQLTYKQDVDLDRYALLRALISHGEVGIYYLFETKQPDLKWFTGLRPIYYYDYVYQGSVVKGNGLEQKAGLFIKSKPAIEIARTFCFADGGVQDVIVSKEGVMQIIPNMGKGDMSNEIRIEPKELSSVKITFDITNVVTDVGVDSTEKLKSATYYKSKDLIGLDLNAIFGDYDVTVSNPNQSTASTASTTSSSSSTKTNTNANPYNSKAKKVWVDADSGSGDFKSSFISKLKSKGWTTRDGGTGPGTHYANYGNVTKDYAVLVNIYNGFCAGTIGEAYGSSIQNKLKNKGVQLVVVFDTRTWTGNMKPYRYGDFTGYTAKRAWDDNFSSGDPTIRNVGQWFKNKNAKYCAYPTVDGAIEQFLAGGYFKWKSK